MAEKQTEKKLARRFRRIALTIISACITSLLLLGQVEYTLNLHKPPFDELPGKISLSVLNPSLYKKFTAIQKLIYEENPDLPRLEEIYIVPHFTEFVSIYALPTQRYYNAKTCAYKKNGRWRYEAVFSLKLIEEFPEEHIKAVLIHELGHLKYHLPPHPIHLVQIWRNGLTQRARTAIELEADCFAVKYVGKKSVAGALSLLIRSEFKKNPEKTRFYERIRLIESTCCE